MPSEKSSPWPVAAPFLLSVTVNADHIDGLLHVNNCHYVTWCESAAWRHSESLGLSVRDYQDMDYGMAIRHAEYDYVSAARLDDTLVVGTWLSEADKFRVTREFLILKENDNSAILRGRWKLVCIELSSGRPRKMPTLFMECYRPGLRPQPDE